MLPTRSLSAPSPSGTGEGSANISRKGRRNLTVLGIASIVVLVLLLYGLGTFNGPPASSTVTTTATTSYNTLASSVISSAASYTPAGYIQGSSKQLNPKESGLVSAGYALFSNQGGALANMTILVFNSTESAQTYGDSVINNAQGLSGYADATSTLSGFQHYGACYGYAASDPEGGEYVANGVCMKGNVYIQVHLVSSSSLPSAEGDMSAFVGAAYQGLG